ncbi:hypothetical protein U14_03169 [Candidatus Moduliflexus flocculans]|uniref:Uncharacterized protein n=1 Tax=Candidatus Moduliflexus flocculans TaxID=1499966 RepID=A0A081BNF7_9BACT|nr:hypothetical protein U14_03169 [Candidatus Moduliflexus flocculans]
MFYAWIQEGQLTEAALNEAQNAKASVSGPVKIYFGPEQFQDNARVAMLMNIFSSQNWFALIANMQKLPANTPYTPSASNNGGSSGGGGIQGGWAFEWTTDYGDTIKGTLTFSGTESSGSVTEQHQGVEETLTLTGAYSISAQNNTITFNFSRGANWNFQGTIHNQNSMSGTYTGYSNGTWKAMRTGGLPTTPESPSSNPTTTSSTSTIIPVTDSQTDLGLAIVNKDQTKSVAIFGNKDGSGNLTSVSDITYIPKDSPEQGANIHFNGNYNAPEWTVQTSDGTNVKFSNYNAQSQTADVSVTKTDASGNEEVVKQTSGQPVPDSFDPQKSLDDIDKGVKDIGKDALNLMKDLFSLGCDAAGPTIGYGTGLCQLGKDSSKGFEDVMAFDPVCITTAVDSGANALRNCAKSIRQFNLLPCLWNLWEFISNAWSNRSTMCVEKKSCDAFNAWCKSQGGDIRGTIGADGCACQYRKHAFCDYEKYSDLAAFKAACLAYPHSKKYTVCAGGTYHCQIEW